MVLLTFAGIVFLCNKSVLVMFPDISVYVYTGFIVITIAANKWAILI